MKVLVYDPVSGGHHDEYLAHLVVYLCETCPEVDATFIVHPEFLCRHSELVKRGRRTGGIRFEDRQVGRVSEEKGVLRLATDSLREWCFLEGRARQYEADHCIVMELNPLQLGLAFHRSLPFAIHGILFHPYTRLRKRNGTLKASFDFRVQRARKRWLLRRVARHPSVRSVFLLNDRKSVRLLSRFSKDRRNVFAYLPDPVFRGNADSRTHSASTKVLRSRFRYLLVTPGAIRRNKGVVQALEALTLLGEGLSREVGYLIAGRIEPGFEDELRASVALVRRRNPGVHVRVENGYLERTVFQRVIAQSDLVLIPYRRTEGSSGILGHAAREGVPVIGPSEGLIGELIEQFDLGVTVDTSDPHAIARAVAGAVADLGRLRDTMGMLEYVGTRTPSSFASTIIARLPDDSRYDHDMRQGDSEGSSATSLRSSPS